MRLFLLFYPPKKIPAPFIGDRPVCVFFLLFPPFLLLLFTFSTLPPSPYFFHSSSFSSLPFSTLPPSPPYFFHSSSFSSLLFPLFLLLLLTFFPPSSFSSLPFSTLPPSPPYFFHSSSFSSLPFPPF